jgi:hypothetical protein
MEVFGASRTVNPIGQIRGSEFAKVYMGSIVALAQSFQAQYGRQSKPIMSIGDPNIYFVPGQAQGTVTLGRLLGADGLLSLLNAGLATCGTIQNLQLTVGGGRCLVAPSQTLNFGGGILETVSVGLSSGAPEIMENYSMRISSMEKA